MIGRRLVSKRFRKAGQRGALCDMNIRINSLSYIVDKPVLTIPVLTGEQLRMLCTPTIPQDEYLYLIVPGSPDVKTKIEDQDVVSLTDGMRFFTGSGSLQEPSVI